MINSDQSRAARGMLNWTQKDLASATGISKTSIVRFEQGTNELKAATLDIIRKTFENAGIIFPDDYGVRRKTDHVEIIQGTDAPKKLWENIFLSLKTPGGEVLITNVDESKGLEVDKSALLEHLAKLQEHNIKERLLSCEGDTNFLMPKEYYRWISKEMFDYGTTTYIYDNKVALQLWDNSMIMLVHSQVAFEAEKRRFEYTWKKAKIPTNKNPSSKKK